MRVRGTYGWGREVAPPRCVKRATPSEPLRPRRDKTGRAKLRRPKEAGDMEQNRAPIDRSRSTAPVSSPLSGDDGPL